MEQTLLTYAEAIGNDEFAKIIKEDKKYDHCFIATDTKTFAYAIQIFSFIAEKLDFDRPFKIYLDYDPERPKLHILYSFPKEAD